MTSFPRRWVISGLFAFLGAARLSAVLITVNDVGDALHSPGCATTGVGTCTLRDAITFANTTAVADDIHFAVAGAGVHTIHPSSPLPNISHPVTIDGYTQTGASANTLAVGDDAVLLIEVSGDLTGSSNGFQIFSDDCTIRGLVINQFSNPAIFIDSTGGQGTSGGHVIEGNFIGTDPTGKVAKGNGGFGIFIRSPNNRIGGTTPAARNLISGNGPPPLALSAGIRFEGDFGASVAGGRVEGNYIGTDASGTAALPNGGGIATFQGAGVTIGGTAAGAGNLISGNAFYGIDLGAGFCAETTAHTIQGNRIGTDAQGTGPLGNGKGGIHAFCMAHDNAIGGTAAGAGNVIAFNGAGDATGGGIVLASSTAGNAVLGNAIFANTSSAASGGLGIDLNSDGPSANDACDADGGANGRQNAPIVTAVLPAGGSVDIHGFLESTANATYRIEFFSNPTPDPTGFNEGQIFLGSTTASTDASCHATFVATFPGSAVNVTATATDADNDTSEFSHPQVAPKALEADPTNLATSDGNGVFEPGETVTVRPTWTNLSGGTLSFTASASALTGPAGGAYATVDGAASYSPLPASSSRTCGSACYAMSGAPTAGRPITHWDATFIETPSTGDATKTWNLHLGDSFTDVPRNFLFYKKIETVFHNAITVGCTPTQYCPNQNVPRDQMAIFIARAIAHGGGNVPVSGLIAGKAYNCVAGGASLFEDVEPESIACKSIHYIAAKNVTTGCNATHYCPEQFVSRAQMAIFVAKGIVAPAGGPGVPLTYTDPVSHLSYSCDLAGTPQSLFSDVTPADAFCKHVNYLYAKSIIAGCNSGYCPDENVTRGEMAKFLGNAFSLLLYGL